MAFIIWKVTPAGRSLSRLHTRFQSELSFANKVIQVGRVLFIRTNREAGWIQLAHLAQGIAPTMDGLKACQYACRLSGDITRNDSLLIFRMKDDHWWNL